MIKSFFIKFLITTLLSSCIHFCFAIDTRNQIETLWKLHERENDPNRKHSILLNIGNEYFSESNFVARDSVFQMAIANEYVKPDGNKTTLMQTYSWYFNKEYTYTNKNALDIAKRMEQIAKRNNNEEWLYETYLVFYKIYFAENNGPLALGYITKANYYANILNNEHMKAKSLLAIGQCQEDNNNNIEAFRNFRDAMYIANKINDDTLLYDSYQFLSDFFRNFKNYEKAKEYNQKQLSILLRHNPIDSLKLMYLYNELANTLYQNKENTQTEKITYLVINYAFRRHDDELNNIAFAVYRNYLIEIGNYNKLSEFYTKQYPDEFARMAIQDPLLFYRMKAYIKEADKQLDSSLYYYLLSEEMILKKSTDNVFIANFFRRFGQFLLRDNDTIQAKVKFEQCVKYARQAHYFPFIIEATKYLDAINFREHNLAAAYEYEKQNRLYSDSQATAAREDELLLLEIDNENKLHELNEAKERADTMRRHNLQYVLILIFISILFTILLMLGIFKVNKIVINSIGFISFILLFEFIVIVTDAQIEKYTNGEPWKILLFKLVIISILAPIHHKLEHNLLHYLYDKKLLDPSKMQLRPLIARIRKKIESESEKEEN